MLLAHPHLAPHPHPRPEHGWSEHNALSYAPRAALLAAIATAVESLPVPWDNATVFLAVVLADAAIL